MGYFIYYQWDLEKAIYVLCYYSLQYLCKDEMVVKS